MDNRLIFRRGFYRGQLPGPHLAAGERWEYHPNHDEKQRKHGGNCPECTPKIWTRDVVLGKARSFSKCFFQHATALAAQTNIRSIGFARLA